MAVCHMNLAAHKCIHIDPHSVKKKKKKCQLLKTCDFTHTQKKYTIQWIPTLFRNKFLYSAVWEYKIAHILTLPL